MIDFYYVDPIYIDYLQKIETEKRGFTRVPNMRYEDNRNRKFIVGVVFDISGYNYYAPVSHYNQQKSNNVLIVIPNDKKKPIKGSIRFNYMFPVADEYLTRVEIKKIKNEGQKRLMLKELKFCENNETLLQLTALKTYLEVVMKPEVPDYACDFQLLEQALNNPPSLNTETEDSDKGLALVE